MVAVGYSKEVDKMPVEIALIALFFAGILFSLLAYTEEIICQLKSKNE